MEEIMAIESPRMSASNAFQIAIRSVVQFKNEGLSDLRLRINTIEKMLFLTFQVPLKDFNDSTQNFDYSNIAVNNPQTFRLSDSRDDDVLIDEMGDNQDSGDSEGESLLISNNEKKEDE